MKLTDVDQKFSIAFNTYGKQESISMGPVGTKPMTM